MTKNILIHLVLSDDVQCFGKNGDKIQTFFLSAIYFSVALLTEPVHSKCSLAARKFFMRFLFR